MNRRFLLGTGAFLAIPSYVGAFPLESEVIRLAHSEVLRPLSFRGPDQRVQGIYVDVLNETLGKRMGMALDHRCYPWKRAQELVRAGEADAFCTAFTQERAAYTAAGTESMLTVAFQMYASSDSPKMQALQQVKSFGDLRGFVVAAHYGNGYLEQLFNRIPGLKVEWARDSETAFNKFALGRGDVFIAANVVARHTIRRLNLVSSVVELPQWLEQVQVYFCARRGTSTEKLLPALDQQLKWLKQSEMMRRILARYQVEPLSSPTHGFN
jgi:polar amino acid transport system substrate-binding protein